MKTLIKFITVIFVPALGINVAQANDGAVNFQGRVSTTTCTISVNGVVTPLAATITLPTVQASLLNVAPNFAGVTDFDIQLSDCMGTATRVRAFFEPGADVADGRLINRGSAPNVVLRLLDKGTNPPLGQVIHIGANQNWMATVPFISGGATIPYRVRYDAYGGIAGPGSVVSSVTYSIVYE